MIRFKNKRYWEKETNEYSYVERILNGQRRFESVADHSWHLADCLMIVAPRFPDVNVSRCVQLAVLHDKLEIWSQDASPLGRDGSGLKTFAFNSIERRRRERHEEAAARLYLKTLGKETSEYQRALIEEFADGKTIAARLVKAFDKLQVLLYLLARKNGDMDDGHIVFNIRYARVFVLDVPRLLPYYEELIRRILQQVANFRDIEVEQLRTQLAEVERDVAALIDPPQLDLNLDS